MDTIGLDLHKRESQLCIIAKTQMRRDQRVSDKSANRRLSSSSKRCRQLKKNRRQVQIVLDAGCRFTECCKRTV